MYNHMVGRAASVISPLYFILLDVHGGFCCPFLKEDHIVDNYNLKMNVMAHEKHDKDEISKRKL